MTNAAQHETRYHSNYHSNAARIRPASTPSASNGGLFCRFYTSPYNLAPLRKQQRVYFYQQQHVLAQNQARVLRPRVFPTEVMQSVPLFDFPQMERTWDDDKSKKRVKFSFTPPGTPVGETNKAELIMMPRANEQQPYKPKRARRIPDYHAYKRDEKTGRLPVIHEEKGILPPIVEKYSEGFNQKKLPRVTTSNGEAKTDRLRKGTG